MQHEIRIAKRRVVRPGILRFHASSARVVVCLLCILPISVLAQQGKDSWQRVYTGEESLIDVDVSSLTFEASRIVRVRFRTIYSKPESLTETPAMKYKSRLETIEFKLTEKRYRFRETSLLDSTGKTIQFYEAPLSEDWKIPKSGGIMEKLFSATRALPPFGNWNVVAYRFGDGSPVGAPDLTRLIGTRVSVNSDSAAVGVKVCSSPDYQSKPVDDQEFYRELGISLKSIGIKTNHADTIVVKCERDGWAPPRSLLVKLPEGGMLMLWEGVFLVLKRERY